MGFEPQGQKAYCKLVNFFLWLLAPRGERPKLLFFPETALCVVQSPGWGGRDTGRDLHLQRRLISIPGCQSPRFAVGCTWGEDAQINAKTACG